MKKLAITLTLLLGMSMAMFAQGFMDNNDVYEEKGLFGRGDEIFGMREQETPLLPPGHGLTDNQDASSPLGSGIAVLVGLGAAYVVAKKRKEE